MKAKFLKVIPSAGHSFHLRKETTAYFENPWHFHPELELTLILKGKGTRFVGDGIAPFGPGDITLVGSNLPHYWRNDPVYYENPLHGQAEAVILRFLPSQLGLFWQQIPEMSGIEKCIERAKKGILLHGSTQSRVTGLLLDMLEQDATEKFLNLLKVLHWIAVSEEYDYLSNEGFVPYLKAKEEERIQKAYDHIVSSFMQPISLEQIAEMVHMESTSFSRFFKKCTGNSFLTFLTEVRIGHASRLLMETDWSISRVQHESGFNNQASFNQMFRKHRGRSPKEYRKLFR